eukprot:TRINITY_DN4301_c0_g1_i3.p1 TRINITY_DN4301_c0_g1~~TRINITY_DN4301_c0_g1_i3.p1  ORF type:complete len:206 (+),score=11.50 TRINITY_DN4301_c0_g1_i3:90-707(+)
MAVRRRCSAIVHALCRGPTMAASLFDGLPDEVLLLIFQYLNPTELVRTALTCLRFNQVSSDGALWEKWCMGIPTPNHSKAEDKTAVPACRFRGSTTFGWRIVYNNRTTVRLRVRRAWKRLHDFLSREGQSSLRPGAPFLKVAQLYDELCSLGYTIPEPLLASLMVHDGQQQRYGCGDVYFVDWSRFLSVSEILEVLRGRSPHLDG